MNPDQQNQYKQAIELVTVNPQQATQFFTQNYAQPGFCLGMMMLASDQSLSIQHRQFAITQLKQAVFNHWNPKQGIPIIGDSDKKSVRDSFIDALKSVVGIHQLRNTYLGVVEMIVLIDFPQNWSGIIENITNRLLTSQDFSEVEASLIILQQIFSANKLFMEEKREEITQVITQTSSGLGRVCSTLSQHYNEGTAEMVKLLLKIYDAAIYIDICPFLADKQVIQNWMSFIKIILDTPIPQNLTQISTDPVVAAANKKHVMWRNRKWCGRILCRYAEKYGLKINVAHKQHQQHIPQTFESNYINPFLESFVTLLFNSQQQYVSPQVIHFSLKFLHYSLRYNTAFQTVHPHLEKVLFDICLPLCSHNMDDEELYTNNADDYLRKEEDYSTTTHQNKNCAIELIEKIIQLKKDQNTKFLFPLITFIQQYLTNNADPRTQKPLDICQREGLLWVFGRLRKYILEDEGLTSSVESILQQHILPCLTNQQSGLLRARGCWVFGRFSSLQIQNNQLIIDAINGIGACLNDKEMPVKIRAAIALEGLCQHEAAQQQMKQHLEMAFKMYVQLMEDSQFDGLVEALQGIVKIFQNDLSPHAFNLVTNLSNQFQTFITSNEDQIDQATSKLTPAQMLKQNKFNEDDDNAGYQRGAISCLDAIINILDAPLPTSVYEQLTSTLTDVIDFCFIDPNMRYTEEGFGILNQLLLNFNPKSQLQNNMWFYFSYLIYAVMGIPNNAKQSPQWQLNENQQLCLQNLSRGRIYQDFLENIIAPIKNYVQKGKQQFFTETDFLGNTYYNIFKSLIMDTLSTFNPNNKDDENGPQTCDMAMLINLYICLIENNPGQINNELPAIIEQVYMFINNNSGILKDKQLTLCAHEVIAMSLYYNPEFTFQYLQSKGYIQPLYNSWVQCLPHYKHDYDRGRCLLGLNAVFKLPQDQIPQELVSVLPLIVQKSVQLTTDILEARNEDDSDFESDNELEDNNDLVGQATDKEISDYHSTLSKLQKISNKMNGQENDDDINDDLSDQDYDIEENIGQHFRYKSPLDQDCEILLFQNIILNLKNTNQQLFDNVFGSLDSKQQETLQKNFQQAQTEQDEYLKSINQQQQA